LNRSDYEKLSEHIVEGLAGGVPLEDGIVSAAKDRELNPDQIKRLVEVSNTNAFLKLFKSLSGDDRMVDFDVADPSSVLKKFYAGGSPKVIKKTVIISMSGSDDSDFFGDIKDELRVPAEAEVAEAPSEEPSELKTASAEPLGMPKFKLMRLRDSILDKLAHAEYRASEIADELAQNFSGIYSREKLSSFESDCISLHGNTALPALEAIRSRVGVPTGDYTLAKEASFNSIVDSSKGGFSKVAEYLREVEDYKAATGALGILEKLKEQARG